MLGIIAFGLALALLILHFIERSVPPSYAVAAFIAAAVVAAGDLREPAGQICTTTTTSTTTTTADLPVVQAYPVETCVTRYALKFESLVALIAAVAFAVLTLAIYLLERLAADAGGWTV
jgi:hypothetical protein